MYSDTMKSLRILLGSATQWQFDQSSPVPLVLSPSLLILLIRIIAVKKIPWRAEKSVGLVCCKFKVKKIIKNIGIFSDTSLI